MKFDKAREKIRNHSGPELYLDGTPQSNKTSALPNISILKNSVFIM